jgi:hypothetical protein
MKKIIFIFSIYCLLHSCIKDNDPVIKCDCSNSSIEPEQVDAPEIFCNSDTCQTYFNIWKDIFLSKNQMSQEYFDEHVILRSSLIHKWAKGISLEISYDVKIEWVESRLQDKFIFYITSNYFPGLDVPRNTLLSKDQIVTVIDGNYFSSRINKIIPFNHLKFSSETAAIRELINASNVDTFCTSRVSFPQKSFDKYTVGHPYLIAGGIINWEGNQCIEGSIDLINGETLITNQVCYILFCFSKGTQIIQPEGSKKSIEKIEIGDKILTLNLSTMNVEEDIVQKVDSSIHNDMIKIVFNDSTTNYNTSDHPYFVKGKGWSSFSPMITRDKYRINTAQLQIGDTCFKYQNKELIEVIVKTLKEESKSTVTYNISSLKKNKNYFANGILVSNENK